MCPRVADWSRLPKPQPCAVCGRDTNARVDPLDDPLHFECSSAGVTGSKTPADLFADAKAPTEIDVAYALICRALAKERGDPNHRWSPWNKPRESLNRHDRKRPWFHRRCLLNVLEGRARIDNWTP